FPSDASSMRSSFAVPRLTPLRLCLQRFQFLSPHLDLFAGPLCQLPLPVKLIERRAFFVEGYPALDVARCWVRGLSYHATCSRAKRVHVSRATRPRPYPHLLA